MSNIKLSKPDTVAAAVSALVSGGIVVYPTETLYGLGADACSEDALRRLAALKGRDAGKPISVLVSSRAMLLEMVASLSEAAERLMARFWPGALTLVLPARSRVSTILTGGRGTIGVRISSHPAASALAAELGRPVTATSANPGGVDPAMEVSRARSYFGPRVDVYLDGGPAPGGPGSTVIVLAGYRAVLIREGAIPISAIESCGVSIGGRL